MGSQSNNHSGSAGISFGDSNESLAPPLVKPHPVDATDDRTKGERLADNVVSAIGTWTFLIIQSLGIAGWISLRVIGVSIDNPQLTILNLCLSVQAAMTGPLLLLASNRKSVRDRQLAAHDFDINQQALEKILELHAGKAPPKMRVTP